MAPTVVLSFALTLAALEVDGDVTCPTPAEVAARLRPLLAREVGAPGDRVRLDRADGVLRVALVGADGRVRGVRNVDDRHDCSELADAAAIIVASWQGEGGRGAGEELLPPGTGAVAVVAAPGPAPAVAAVGRGWRLDGGLGIAASAVLGSSGGVFAPALALDGNLTGAAGGLGVHLRARAGGGHEQTVAPADPTATTRGQVRWRRVPVAIGPSWSWIGERWTLVGDLSAAAAWLAVEGAGFATNQHHDTLDLGASGGVGLMARLPFRPWVGFAAWLWPRRTVAEVRSDGARVALPRFELMLAVGIGLELAGAQDPSGKSR